MGERPEVDQALDDVVWRLTQAKTPGPRPLFLYGPRGTGKTVHIRDFQARIRQSQSPEIMMNLADGLPATRREEMVTWLKDSISPAADRRHRNGRA